MLCEFSDELSRAVLERRNLAISNLAVTLGGEVGALAVFLVFIFAGIQAFTIPGSFESAINALLPAAAGAGVVGSAQEQEGPQEEANADLQEDIELALDDLTEAD